MYSIRDIIRQAIVEGRGKRLTVTTDNFFVRLLRRSEPHGPRRGIIGRFLLIAATLILALSLVLGAFIFFIGDVLLYRPQVRINAQGAFIPTNSCGREYALFMFNSADVWADTGIQLRCGDRIKISASGGFHSSISRLHDAARENYRPRYSWYDSHTRDAGANIDGSGTENCIYTGPDAYFGSILYQIGPEAVECACENEAEEGSAIRQLSRRDGSAFREVIENGILRFTVNDIYLTDRVIERLERHNRMLVGSRTADGRLSDERLCIPYDSTARRLIAEETLQLYFVTPDSTSLCIAGKEFRDHFRDPDRRKVWFEDNVGEILLNIEIQRKLTSRQFLLHGIVSWYRDLEESADTIRGQGFAKGCAQLLRTAWIFLSLLLNPIVLAAAAMLLLYALAVFRPWKGSYWRAARTHARRLLRRKVHGGE